MANRSYPPFGKVKTIVIPWVNSGTTLKAFKERFGIDLMPFIEYDDEEFKTKYDIFSNTLLLVQTQESEGLTILIPPTIHTTEFGGKKYIVFNTHSYFVLEDEEVQERLTGIALSYSKTDPFDEEHIMIDYYEE